MRPAIRVRPAREPDLPALLGLMKGLADFEGYAADFAVNETTLLRQGFERQPPDFHALVAEGAGTTAGLLGMLVYYFVPFTFRARPTLYIKEVYVAESGRGRGVGEALMRAAAIAAVEQDCALIKWQVAEWNTDAQRFYRRLGATAAPEWVDFSLSEAALRSLAGQPSGRDPG